MVLPLCSCLAVGFRRLARACPVTKVAQKLFLKIKKFHTERIAWLRDYYEALSPYSEPGGYVNFMQDDDDHRVRDNYRQNYDRLVQVKRTYDPDNLFHLNQNVVP